MVCWDTGEGEERMGVCIGTTCLSGWLLSKYAINCFASLCSFALFCEPILSTQVGRTRSACWAESCHEVAEVNGLFVFRLPLSKGHIKQDVAPVIFLLCGSYFFPPLSLHLNNPLLYDHIAEYITRRGQSHHSFPLVIFGTGLDKGWSHSLGFF